MNNIKNICQYADEEARRRSRAGDARQLQQYRTDFDSDPANGGSKGYDVNFRLRVLEYADMHTVKEAAEAYGVSKSTIYSWYKRLHPYRMTGNGRRTKLVERDQVLLSLCVFMYPTANADEICAFIVANGGKVYERYAVYKRLSELNITRKRGSIEAYEGYSEENMLKERRFFGLPPPLGIQGVS